MFFKRSYFLLTVIKMKKSGSNVQKTYTSHIFKNKAFKLYGNSSKLFSNYQSKNGIKYFIGLGHDLRQVIYQIQLQIP